MSSSEFARPPYSRSTTHNSRLKTQDSRLFPAIVLLSTAALCAMVYGSFDSPARTGLALWFLLACPGLALVRLVRIEGQVAMWTLAIALSIALDSVVSTVMVYAQVWSPEAGLAVLAAITAVAALVDLFTTHDSRLTTPHDIHR